MIEWYNYSIGLDLESGEYQVDLYGLKRIEPLKRESKNVCLEKSRKCNQCLFDVSRPASNSVLWQYNGSEMDESLRQTGETRIYW